jgi:hypothetical protein
MKTLTNNTWIFGVIFLMSVSINAQTVAEIMPGSTMATGNDNDILSDWLDDYGLAPSGTLLYRRSTHGANANTFHNLVDDKGPTLVVFKASNGQVFGGYSPNSWSSSSPGYKSSSQAFLFNLNSDRKASIFQPQYSIYTRSDYGPTFGGGHDIYINNSMNGGYFNSYSYNTIDGSPIRSNSAIKALTGANTTSSRYFFGAGFITEIEVYQITYNLSVPIIQGQDITIVLDANGNANISPQDIDTGTTDPDGTVTLSIDKSNYNCEDLGSSSKAITPVYVGSVYQPSHSHGGGFNPNTDEFWYPGWIGSSVNKYDKNHNALGSFNSGQAEIMQLWMDKDSETDFYMANWRNNSITKRTPNSKIWSTEVGYLASGVSTDANFVYAFAYNSAYIKVLDKNTGSFIRNINLPGSILSYGSLVVANGFIYIGGAAQGWSSNPNNWRYLHQLDMDGNYIGSTFTVSNTYAAAFDGETIWFSNIGNDNMIYGVKIAEGNAYRATNSVTLTATDPLGNSSSESFNVTIVDNIAPTITLNGDATLSVFQDGLFTDPSATATDNCSTEIQVNGTVDVNTIGPYTLTYKAIDIAGNESEPITRTVNVIASLVPDITSLPDIVEPCEATPSAPTANNGDITATTEVTFPIIEQGTTEITWTFDDGNGNVSTQTQNVTVKDEVAPTAIAQDVIVQLDASGAGSTTAIAVDNGSNDACGIASLELSKTDFDYANIGDNEVTLTVTDNNGNQSTIKANVLVKDEVAPTAIAQDVIVQLDASGAGSTTAALVDNGSNDAGGIESLVLSKTDFDCTNIGNDNEVTLTVTDNNGNQSTIKANVLVKDEVAPTAIAQDVIVQLDASGVGSTTAALVDNGSNDACGIASLELSKTDFDCTNIGDNEVTLTVTDNNGNQSTIKANVLVKDEVAPTAIAQDVIVQLDANGAGSTTAALVDNGSNDACGIESLVLSKTDFDCSNIGDNEVTLTVTDNNGNQSTIKANVLVKDEVAPTAITQDVIVQLDASGAGSTTAALVDNGSNDACGIASLELSKTDFDCTNIGDNEVTLTVTDNNGNQSTIKANVLVKDEVAPTAIAQDVIVQLDASGAGSTTAALVDNGSNDACGIASLELSKTDFDCSNIGDNEVTLTVTDNNGNQSTIKANVLVKDEVAPTAIAQDVIVQLDASGAGSTTAALVDNGSNDACGIESLVLSKTDFDCTNIGDNEVTLTVTDNNGNISTIKANVLVKDEVAPTAIAQDVIVQLDASGAGSTTAALVDNGSNDACGIESLVLSKTDFDCTNIGDNEVTLTVTDNNGNQSTIKANVLVKDKVAPTAIAQDVIVQLDANGAGSTTAALVDNGSNDACGIASLELSKTDFDCSNIGDNEVTLTVTDNNGNISTIKANVLVKDEVAPTAIAQDVIVQLDANGAGSTTAALVDNGSNDACGIESLVLSKTDFDCSNIGDNEVTLTVTDNNGNQSTIKANVLVKDEVAPIISCSNDSNHYIDPYQTYYTVEGNEFDASATDNCGIASLTYTGGLSNTSGSSMSGIQLNVGANTLNWTAIDVNGNKSSCSTIITVQKRPTTLTYTGDLVEQYSDQVNLSAKLVDVEGLNVQGKLITFTIGTQKTTATTDNTGIASTTLILTQDPALDYTVKAEFGEDGSYLGSEDSDNFDVNQEDAIVEYTGQSLQATESSRSGLATIQLTANIQDITVSDPVNDPNAGDIRNAKVKFVNRDTNSYISGWIPVSDLLSSGDLRTGAVTFDWTVDIGSQDSESFTIGIIVDQGYYLRDKAEDNVLITIYKPVGDFITGGGFIVPTNTSGSYASGQGLKTNFGFNVKYNKKGTKLRGHMNVIFRSLESDGVHIYQIKGNAIQSLGVNVVQNNLKTAEFITKSNLKDITNPLNPVDLGGGLILKVNMTDRGEPGRDDSIAIELTDRRNKLLYSSNWTGISTRELTLEGGNTLVHSGFSLNEAVKRPVEKEIAQHFNVSYWPNPSNDMFKLNVSSSNKDDKVQVLIFDMLGRQLSKKEIAPNEEFLFGQSFANGIYLVHLAQGDKMEQIRLIKK